MNEDKRSDSEGAEMAVAVLTSAGNLLQDYWRLVFRRIAQGGPASPEELEVLRATAAKLKIKTVAAGSPVPGGRMNAEPNIFGRILLDLDQSLPDHGAERNALRQALVDYPEACDAQRAHLRFLTSVGSNRTRDWRTLRKARP